LLQVVTGLCNPSQQVVYTTKEIISKIATFYHATIKNVVYPTQATPNQGCATSCEYKNKKSFIFSQFYDILQYAT
jgi:hypothetical protein